MPVKFGGGDKPASSQSEGKPPMNFMKSGNAAQQMLKQEEAKAEAAKQAAGKTWRFRIPEDRCGDDYTITFLDGDLDEDGSLSAPMWMEHTVFLAGKWQNVPCVSESEPCPLCASADNRAALVAGFTVIDHTPYKIQKGPNAGTVVKDQRRLFVAKRTTYAILQKLASKQGGLRGCTFEVSRQGDKDPNVGNLFQFVEKRSLSQLKKLYEDAAEPADWNEEITYYTAAELNQMGVKGAVAGKVGGVGNSKDLDNELGFG